MRHIIVIAYQLHYSKGTEYAVAWDYIMHMSRNNKLTVLYGSCEEHHQIGRVEDMELFLSKHDFPNVEFLAVKPSFKSKE